MAIGILGLTLPFAVRQGMVAIAVLACLGLTRRALTRAPSWKLYGRAAVVLALVAALLGAVPWAGPQANMPLAVTVAGLLLVADALMGWQSRFTAGAITRVITHT